MKRKIERYLSNNEKHKVPQMDDGRYDFKGDLEGVLSAVRYAPPESGSKRSNSGRKASRSRSQGNNHGHGTYFTSYEVLM